ncbi:MAG: ATP-binding cassette domain-containing protein [Spirochaetales bacterium]|nr:ATP-binding cassette domain-containing protein [Spirochaetales bacterium]
MIEASNLGKKYGSLEAVRGVSFAINPGEVVGLLGPNGAGKTTIMKILTCYMFPSYGEARVAGFDVFEAPLEVKRAVGYLPENAPLYTDLNVMEYLDFMAEARALKGSRKSERIEWVIEECGLGRVVYRGIDAISKGFRQRTGLAQAMLHDPDILILDEPTTGLDPNQIIEIRQLITRLGKRKTVILSTHILQEVEATCNRVLILNEGEIVAKGTAEEIQREMKGEVLLRLLLKGGSEPAAGLSRVAGVREVLRSRPVPSERYGQCYDVQLALTPDSEAEEAVFDWSVREGFKILQMVPQRLSLEEVFTKLTREGGPNAR